jgi:endonuclease YncB( thermonuclease family)
MNTKTKYLSPLGCYAILALALISCFLTIEDSVLAGSFSGQVVGVLDGDTIEVLHDQKPERIRLYGIDCPEKWQAFGQKAKQATSTLVFGKEVSIETHGRDKHRRTLGTVVQNGMNVNQELVKEGWCWWFSKYVPKDTVLKRLEQEAKEAKKGLWADPNPIPPWLYRRLDRGAYP